MKTESMHATTGSSVIMRTEEKSLRALVARLMDENSTADVDSLFSLFDAALDDLPEYEMALRRYALTNFVNYERRIRAGSSRTPADNHAREVAAAQRVERIEKVSEAVTARVIEISLLLLMMPNGKAMRYCTGHEMAAFGKGYERLGKKVGAKTVGEVLTEDDVRKFISPARNIGA